MLERLTRRRLLTATAGTVMATAGSSAHAESWPTKPIRVLMPFGAGGSMDVLSRLLAPIVSELAGAAGDRREPSGRHRNGGDGGCRVGTG